MIAMRMIWSPITLPMSVAPRGFGVWQPPTVPIMYCFFNHPSISNFLPQSFHLIYVYCVILLYPSATQTKYKSADERSMEDLSKGSFSCCIVYSVLMVLGFRSEVEHRLHFPTFLVLYEMQ